MYVACMALSDWSTSRVCSSLSNPTLWPHDPCSHLIWQTDTFFNVISTYGILGTTLNLPLDFPGNNCLPCQLPVGCIHSPRSLLFAVWSSQFWNFTVCPPTTLAGVCMPAYNINYTNLNTWASCIPEYHKALCSIPSYALMTEMGFFSLLTHAIHSYPNMERSSFGLKTQISLACVINAY